MSRTGTHMSHPSELVDPLAQFEYPQASRQPAWMVQPLQPRIQLTDSIRHAVRHCSPPAARAVSTLTSPSPASCMARALASYSYVSTNPYMPQPSPVPFAWYGVWAIKDAYTPLRVQILMLAGTCPSVLLQLLCLFLTPRSLQPLPSI